MERNMDGAVTPGVGVDAGADADDAITLAPMPELTAELLLAETWQSYLAAKSGGTAAQQTTLIKTLLDQLDTLAKAKGAEPQGRFETMRAPQLKAEVLKLLDQAASELGVLVTPL